MAEKFTVKTAEFGRKLELGPYTQGVCVPAGRGLLFTTGILGRDAEGKIAEPYDTAAQTRRILENLKALIAEVGCTMDDVVKITLYMRDIENDLEAIRAVRNEYWPRTPPASTGVEVARLITDDVRIEIEAVVLLPRDQ